MHSTTSLRFMVWLDGQRHTFYSTHADALAKVAIFTRIGWSAKVVAELWERTSPRDGMQDDEWRNWRFVREVTP